MSDHHSRFLEYLRHFWLRLTGRRVVYLDCGANTGAVLEDEIRKHPAREYFAFEPNPALMEPLRAVKNRHPKTSIQLYNQAVWTEDSTMNFYLSRENSHGELVTDGSTLLHGKVPVHPRSGRIDYDHPLQVQSVDFGQWILNTFSPRDLIYLKMDIEGAEYAVLSRMIEDKSIHYIRKAFVEFHYRADGRLKGISKNTHDSICSRVAQATELILWH